MKYAALRKDSVGLECVLKGLYKENIIYTNMCWYILRTFEPFLQVIVEMTNGGVDYSFECTGDTDVRVELCVFMSIC